MKNRERVLKLCMFSVVLVLIFLNFTRCAEKSKNEVIQEDALLIIEMERDNLEQLKLEKDKVIQKIKEAEELKSTNSTISEAEKKANLKKLEELSEDLLRQSKEIEEKIKTHQYNKN
jgi:hypothetical protein